MMDWQQLLSLCIVACTAAFFIRGALRKKKRASAAPCGNCSECAAGTTTRKN